MARGSGLVWGGRGIGGFADIPLCLAESLVQLRGVFALIAERSLVHALGVKRMDVIFIENGNVLVVVEEPDDNISGGNGFQTKFTKVALVRFQDATGPKWVTLQTSPYGVAKRELGHGKRAACKREVAQLGEAMGIQRRGGRKCLSRRSGSSSNDRAVRVSRAR